MNQFCSLPFAIKALENHIKRYMYQHGDQFHHPTEMQQAVIWYLGQHMGQDIFQRDLEKAFHMRRSTATGILQLMERDHLLVREPVAHDRRLKKLCLTEKALALHQEAVLRLTQIEQRLIEGIAPEELATFHRVVAKMIANIS